jgi:polysaccharide biosynthesis protein PslH
VTPWYPYPPTNGARVRSSKLLAGLAAAGHRCHLFCFEAPAPTLLSERGRRPGEEALASVTIARSGPRQTPGRLRSAAALLGRTPRHYRLSYQPAVFDQIRSVADEQSVDAVIAFELGAGDYVRRLDGQQLIKILDGCEPFMFRAERSSLRARARMWKFKGFLKQMLDGFDVYIAVSPAELAWIRERVSPRRAWGCTVPNGADLAAPYTGAIHADRVIYTGSLTYRANLSAVDFFTSSVWPLVRKARPTATFVVTGQLPEEATVQRLTAISGVSLAGIRSDYREFVSASALLAVPLHEGGGTRIKILEALALGCPVVATHKAIEGLSLQADREVLIADSATDFAAAIVSVLTNAELRDRLVENGRRAAARYSWTASQRLFVDVIASSVQQRAFLQPA